MKPNNLDYAAEIVRNVIKRIISGKNAEKAHTGLDIEESDAYVTSVPSNIGKEFEYEER